MIHPSASRSARRSLYRLALLGTTAVTAFAVPTAAQRTAQRPATPAAPSASATVERVDTAAINRIRDEGMNRSQVMEISSWLTDVHGPRLTGSPGFKAAAEYSVKTLAGWGLANAKLEPWGPFGRGWSSERFSLQVTAPQPFPVIAYPVAWTPGTPGPVSGAAVLVSIDSQPDFERYRGKLRGTFVLAERPRDVPPSFEPLASRYTDEELSRLAQPETPRPGGAGGRNAADPAARERFQRMQELQRQRTAFFREEGVAAVLRQGRGDGGTVFVGGGGSREANAAPGVPEVAVAVEHYGRIARTLAKGVPVTIELDARNRFHDDDLNSVNIIAEIPGTDPLLRDEVVMLGAHFDSWHAGTGATDNAAGSAVMMEAVRILKATGLRPRRTIRIALWSGEEQGLLGSRAYVKDHFGDRETMRLKPAHEKFSAYFNVDNGTGKIRGVYLQGNTAVAPIFEAWMAPFRAAGMTTLTPRNTGGTDHLAFDAVGLPGFQFIQDEVEYGSRTHHSNMDTYERLQPEDMKHNAVVVASFVYLAANRDAKLPRKEIPRATSTQ